MALHAERQRFQPLQEQERQQGGRVDRQAPRVADIGDMVEHLKRLDELLSGLDATGELETNQRAITAGKIGVRSPARLTLHDARKDDPDDFFLFGQELGHLVGVLAMALHAERQRFQPLQEQERVERAHTGTHIA